MICNLLIVFAFLAFAFADKVKETEKLNWKSVSIDDSGKYHVAVAAYNNESKKGYPFYLSNDYGESWFQSTSPQLDWRNVYSDSTGQTLIGYAEHNSLASSSVPPLYISKNRGGSWKSGASTVDFPVTNDIAGNNNGTLWVSVNSHLYSSSDFGSTWTISTNIPVKDASSSAAVIGSSVAVDSTGQYIYIICDGGLCISQDGGKTFQADYKNIIKFVTTDSTGQYVAVLTDKSLRYSTYYASNWKDIKTYTNFKVTAVPKNFLKMISPHKYIITVEATPGTVTTYRVMQYDIGNIYPTEITLFTFYDDVNDIAVSSSGKSMVLSTVDAGVLYSTKDSGASWLVHEPLAQISRRMKA